MSDTTNANQNTADIEVQTQHVLSVAFNNLTVVIDQLQSLNDARVDSVLEALDTAQTDLQKQIK